MLSLSLRGPEACQEFARELGEAAGAQREELRSARNHQKQLLTLGSSFSLSYQVCLF